MQALSGDKWAVKYSPNSLHDIALANQGPSIGFSLQSFCALSSIASIFGNTCTFFWDLADYVCEWPPEHPSPQESHSGVRVA